MKKNFTLLLCLIIAGFSATSQTIQWQKLLGGTGNDQFTNFKTQQTSDGGYIVVGNTIEAGGAPGGGTGTLTGLTNNGFFDGWVIKLDASGNTTWQKLLGGTDEDRLFGAQQTADGGYIIVGYSNSSNSGTLTGITGNGFYDAWIIKLDANGNTTWQKLFGGNNQDYFFGITQTSDGGYIASGQASSSNSGTLTGITNNGGAADGWVVKMDATGTIIWQKLLGGNDLDALREVRQTADGGYVTAGYSTSSNTGTLTGVINNGVEDGWVVKLDAAGNTTWQKLFGGSNTDYLTPILQTADGGYLTALASSSSNTGTLTGLTNNGGFDGWIIKLDASGNTTWQKLLGGSNDDYLYGCRQTLDGGYIVAGYSNSSNSGTLTGITTHGSNDGWFIKLNATGNILSQQLLGGIDDDRFYTAEQTSDGGYIMEGYSATSDGSGTFTGIAFNGGASDGWVLKLNAGVLPVTLQNLGAKYIAANNIEVSWQTSSEQNNKGFEVYRSTNEINYSLIGFVAGAINSNRLLQYNFSDNSSISGKVFYRLKQIDEDGNGKFSSIVYVIISKQNVITFSPNPVKNFITIVSSNNIKEIKLVNTNGQLTKRWNNISQNAKLNIGNISKGVYYIKFINDDFVQTQKLMKE